MTIEGTCGGCGLRGHRYGTTDPNHSYSATACVNSLRGEVEQLAARLDAVLCALQDIEGCCRSARPSRLRTDILTVVGRHAADLVEYGVVGSAPRIDHVPLADRITLDDMGVGRDA